MYELSGWIRSDGTPTALGAKGYGGSEDSQVSATTWTRTALQFTTGANSTTATVYCYREKPGQAFCDDLEPTGSGPEAVLTSKVKVGFGGSFTTATGYTPSTGENVDGTLSRMAGSEQLDGGAVTLASRDVLTAHHPDYLARYPAESDVSIRPGWFWHASQDSQVKTPAKLLDLYRTSVGRNSVLLLNVPPNRAGRISDPDTAALASFGQTVRATYGANLLVPPGGSPLTDEQLTSAWSPAGDAHSGETVLESPQPVTFDRVVLQQDITRGQRVESFAVDIWDGTMWRTVVQAGTIGYKRIEYLSAPATASKVRLRVLGARANPHVAKLGLYKAS
ncbi:alpha-L-fucosidase [Streptomyces sp. NPDC059832]|uniref:alpha-L-fucosidase n=1 Tax=Streptomyces sp. NPDC059832 TaxID=3346966 RepID=UPI00365F2D98